MPGSYVNAPFILMNFTSEYDENNDTSNNTFNSKSMPNVNDDDYLMLTILFICCAISLIVNIMVIASARWIRSMTPNIKMSLSLAAADAASSFFYGFFIILSREGNGELQSLFLVVEILRLCSIVITVVHLLALSLNHYIGILKPLHYNSIVTSKKVVLVIWILWLLPFSTILTMCLVFREYYEDINFVDTFQFRVSYSSLFFVPIIIMALFYFHILFVVRKQQVKWKNLSRMGSTRMKGNPTQKIHKEKKQLESNVRAIYTTLLILGSCVIGWSPALLIYVLTCQVDCYITWETSMWLNNNYPDLTQAIRLTENVLMIMKMLANPIIYSIRMKEVKDGMRRMLLAATRSCNKSYDPERTLSYLYRTPLQNSLEGDTVQVKLQTLKSNSDTCGEENTFL